MSARISVVVVLILLFDCFPPAHAQTWKELLHQADSLLAVGFGPAMPAALDLARQALPKAEMEFGRADTIVANVLDVLAALLTSATIVLPQEALVHAKRSCEIKESVYGPHHPRVADAFLELSEIYLTLRRDVEAKRVLEQALQIYEKAHATEQARYPSALHNLASYYQRQGDYTKAVYLYRKALEGLRRVLHPDDPSLAYTLTMLAVTYWSLGWFDEAEPLLEEALQNWETKYGSASVRTAICLGNLAQHYELQGRFEEAEALGNRTRVSIEEKLRPDDPMLGRWFLGRGATLVARGRHADAVGPLSKAIECWRHLAEPQTRTAMAMRLLGECYWYGKTVHARRVPVCGGLDSDGFSLGQRDCAERASMARARPHVHAHRKILPR